MKLLKLTSLAIVTSATLGASLPAFSQVDVNRLSVHAGSTWGTDIDADLIGVTGLAAFNDRYVVEISHSDVDLGFDIDGLDTTLTSVKLGLGNHTDAGFLYYYLGAIRADVSFGGESDSGDSYQLGAAWIGQMNSNAEVGFDIGLIKPEDGSIFAEFMVDYNYYLTNNFAVGFYASIDTDAEGQYGVSTSYRF